MISKNMMNKSGSLPENPDHSNYFIESYSCPNLIAGATEIADAYTDDP